MGMCFVLRHHQDEQQINPLMVGGLVVYWCRKRYEGCMDGLAGHSAMWDGNTKAQSSRSKSFALQQAVKNLISYETVLVWIVFGNGLSGEL